MTAATIALALGAALSLLTACGATPAPWHGGGSGQPGPGSGQPSSVASAGPTQGLLPASTKLSDRLVLARTRTAPGRSIHGTLVVVYRGRRPLNLTKGCQPQFAVVLTNHRFPPHVMFPMICLNKPLLVDPGENRWPFTVQTRYPAGRYQAVLIGNNLALPPPAPVAVTLLAAGG